MPEAPDPKPHPHPIRADPQKRRARRPSGTAYAELAVTSNFTFLTGASHPEELVERAAELGHTAAAITDTNSLAGVVRAHVAAKEHRIPLAVGCRLVMDGPLSVLVFPTDRASYGRLCRMLTIGKRRTVKGSCQLTLDDLLAHHDGLLAVVDPAPSPDDRSASSLARLRSVFDDDRLSLAARRDFGADDEDRLRRLADLARLTRTPLVATNAVHYHAPERRPLQDVLACIRMGRTLDEGGLDLAPNAERHLKPPEEMARLFAGHPRAVARAAEIAARASAFSLDELRYEYPDEVVPPGRTAMEHLVDLTWDGAKGRYPGGVPDKVRALVEHEFRLIEQLNYAPYFLTVHDLVRFARTGEACPGQTPKSDWAGPILCQGRGAAANSAVCYCLGVTSVDPGRIDMLFERFVSKERNEPPDIDIDFEHERREEVIQYLYAKYGRDRAALTAEVICYRPRSAIRDVGKAMGLSLDCVDQLAKNLDWWDSGKAVASRVRELGMDPSDRNLGMVLALTRQVQGFPRHLSQHVGGFVLTRTPLCESVPIENAAKEDRTVIEWDKDDIDALGMLKVDVLGLGMLTCLSKSFDLVEKLTGQALTLATIPPEDPVTYDMICQADTVGVFQIESRAQMSMLPRLKPRCFYDLVIEVAIVRPGPIQGDMVHPYLRRRDGEEATDYVHPAVEKVLKRTLGVPLFQEQCMALAVEAAGFTPGEADQLRRAMAAWKRKGDQIARFGVKLIDGMTARGIPREFAERCFEQIKGFSEYGFPESHAASFALLVYASSWLKCHYPAAFAAALINSQPMGFYQPAQIVRDAQEHGVTILPVDANRSAWDCTLEGPRALRLGMRMVKGLRQADADAIADAIAARGPFRSLDTLRRATGIRARSLHRLAAADAFASMGLDRQAALWQARALSDEAMPLFDSLPAASSEAIPALPPIQPMDAVTHDYSTLGLSLKAHPLSFLRDHLDSQDVTMACDLKSEARCPTGRAVTVAGLVLLRQRPSTASGIVFVTLEDETGAVNLIVRENVYKRYRKALRASRAILARGRVERRGIVVHILVTSAASLDGDWQQLRVVSRDFR